MDDTQQSQLQTQSENQSSEEKYVEPIRFVTLNEYCELKSDPQKWVVKKLIPTGGLVNLYAKPKTGKSFLMLSIIEALIEGRPSWDGFDICKHGSVAYLQIDTPREEWMDRATALQQRLSSKENGNKLWLADMWNIPSFPFNIVDPSGTDMMWLQNQMLTINPVLIVIDTLREVHSGDENDNTVMRAVVSNIIKACRGSVGSTAAIVLVSHQRKDGIQAAEGHDDMMDQNRGASYVSGKMDMILRLTRKRLTYKGRAVGLEHVEVEQDPKTHLIRVKGYQKTAVDEKHDAMLEIRYLSDTLKGGSKNEFADTLSKKWGVSRSTAIRRIDEWIEWEEQQKHDHKH